MQSTLCAKCAWGTGGRKDPVVRVSKEKGWRVIVQVQKTAQSHAANAVTSVQCLIETVQAHHQSDGSLGSPVECRGSPCMISESSVESHAQGKPQRSRRSEEDRTGGSEVLFFWCPTKRCARSGRTFSWGTSLKG